MSDSSDDNDGLPGEYVWVQFMRAMKKQDKEKKRAAERAQPEPPAAPDATAHREADEAAARAALSCAVACGDDEQLEKLEPIKLEKPTEDEPPGSECTICCDAKVEVAAEPCGHAFCCLGCKGRWLREQVCPYCSQAVSHWQPLRLRERTQGCARCGDSAHWSKDCAEPPPGEDLLGGPIGDRRRRRRGVGRGVGRGAGMN